MNARVVAYAPLYAAGVYAVQPRSLEHACDTIVRDGRAGLLHATWSTASSIWGITMGRHLRLTLVLAALSPAACGDGDPAPDCEASEASCGDPSGSESLLGGGAATHDEANETANGGTAESTGYMLETQHGLAIEGSFEATSPTADHYAFNSGALGTAREPGFPGVDIQIVIDGEVLDTGGGLTLGLDTVKEFGYSSLLGSGYFMNAALISGEDYVLRLTPAASLAGKRYTIEIMGHVAER
jgi:hypothetical protein